MTEPDTIQCSVCKNVITSDKILRKSCYLIECETCRGRGFQYAGRCDKCRGSGVLDLYYRCDKCGGEGNPKSECKDCLGRGNRIIDKIMNCCPVCSHVRVEPCSSCQGFGVIDLEGNVPSVEPRVQRCFICDGKGKLEDEVIVEIETGIKITVKKSFDMPKTKTESLLDEYHQANNPWDRPSPRGFPME